MKSRKQMSETFLIGTILATVGGFLDAYTYICRGKVFANAQTGNIVLVGVNLAKGDFARCFSYVIPIVSFFMGIVVAEFIRKKLCNNNKIHWRQIIIAFEIIVLSVIAFMPETSNVAVNVFVSFACSLQVQSFRKIDGKSFATTMCTGNLRSATEHLCTYINTKNKIDLQNSLEYYAVIIAFILGAVIGTLLVGIFNFKSIFFACICLILVFFLMFIKDTTIL